MPARRRSVRRGSWYLYTGDLLCLTDLKVGSVVQVVNIPGGFKGGQLRNVQCSLGDDPTGTVHCVNINSLSTDNADIRLLHKDFRSNA